MESVEQFCREVLQTAIDEELVVFNQAAFNVTKEPAELSSGDLIGLANFVADKLRGDCVKGQFESALAEKGQEIADRKPEARDSSEAKSYDNCVYCSHLRCDHYPLGRCKASECICPRFVHKAAEPSPTASEPEYVRCEEHRNDYPQGQRCGMCGPPYERIYKSTDSTADEAKRERNCDRCHIRWLGGDDICVNCKQSVTPPATTEHEAKPELSRDGAKDGNHIGCGRKWSEHRIINNQFYCPPTIDNAYTLVNKNEMQTCEQCKKQYLKHQLECPFCGHGWDEPVQPPADATSLSLLVLDLGNCVVLKVEKGELYLTQPQINLTEGGACLCPDFTFKQAKAAFDFATPVPRIERDGDNAYRFQFRDGSMTFGAKEFAGITAINNGVELPVFEPGTWTEIGHIDDEVYRNSEIRVWRFTR